MDNLAVERGSDSAERRDHGARILIVDDHAAVRTGLKNLVSARPGWFICGEAADGEEAVNLASELKPSVIVMDISMPRMDGLEATRRIREKLPNTEVVVVSQHDSDHVVFEAQKAGARGFVVKSHLSADLLPALEAALLHNTRISAPVAKAWQQASSMARPAPKGGFADPGPHDDLDLMSGGGEMGALMRAHDWAKTPFGPVSQWPQSLRTALRICLDSRFPIVIWWGPELRLLYNDAWRPALGTTKHPQALGSPGSVVWADVWDTIGPMLEGVMRTGQATWENDQLLLFDRHGYVEESYWTYSYSAIRLSSGEVGGVFSAVHEVTDRVLSARRMKTLREVADQVVQAKNQTEACHLAMQSIVRNPADCPYALIFLCEENKVTHVAASFDAGRAIPSAIDLTQNDAWGIRNTIQTHEAQVFEVASPESFPLAPFGDRCKQAITLPILGTNRAVIALMTIGISPYRKLDDSYREFFESLARNLAANINNARAYDEERKRAEALAELDRAKTVFFSNVSHEFRTPLTLMLGPLEDSLAAQEPLPIEHRERLEVAHRNSIRLLRLVNTLLDFSRIQAGRIEASYEQTDIARLTADLTSVFRSATERAGLRLVVNCPPIAEPVYVDREMWEKIVLNLLSNAFKFTFEGEIEVSLRQQGPNLELSVRDTGTGIPEEELPHLFERFHRVKGAQGRTFEGSGIGLSLVQELVRLHGGSVLVTSAPKRGSTFTVSIPLGKEHLPQDRIGAARTLESTGVRGEAYLQEAMRWLPGGKSGSEEMQAASEVFLPAEAVSKEVDRATKTARIVLADDNSDMREYMARLLREHYHVEAAPDGEAALQKVREHRADLILSDIMMPRLDGFGLLQAVRSDEELKDIPVILLSARSGEDSRVEGLQSGADDYLVKPFSAKELLARVKSHLALARARRETAQQHAMARAQAEADRARLMQILDALPAAIYTTDAEGRITHFNPAAVELSGRVPELGSDRWCVTWKLFHSDGTPLAHEDCPMAVALREGRIEQGIECLLERPDGKRVWFTPYPRLLRDAEGKIVGGINMLVDITARKQAEQATNLLAAIVASSDDAIVSKSLDGIITSWNKSAEHMFGYSAEEAIGRPITLIIPPDRLKEEVQILGKLRRGERIDHFHTVRMRKDGSKIDVSLTISPVKDSSGRVIGASKVARDISEEIKAQERERLITAEVISANAKFRAVFEQNTVFAGIMTRDGVLVEANKSCLEVCGYKPEQVLGKRFSETVWWRNHPESREKIQNAIPLVAGGTPYREVLHYSWADGSERLVDFALYPIVDVEGKILFLHSTGVDITDVRRAEEDYRTLADNMSQLAWMADHTGWIFWYNRRWFDYTGTSLDETRGWGWQQVHHPDYVAGVVEKIKKCFESGEVWEDTFPIRGKDGEYRWFLSRAVPIKDAKGKITRWFGTHTDVTELRNIEDALRKAKEFTEEQVRARTRELQVRNAEVLQQSEQVRRLSHRMLQLQDEERRHIARELHDSAGQTLTLLGINLAQLAQKAGRKAPELAADAEMIQETLQQLHREIRTTSYLLHPPLLDEAGLSSALHWYVEGLVERSGLEIKLDIANDFERLPHEMELVIFRLVQECVTNIHRHSESKTASICIARQPNEITVEIRDEGKGMSPEKLAEIQSRGSGVGIRGMRERLRQFDGVLNIESGTSGTRVLVTIPIPENTASDEANQKQQFQTTM